MANRVYDPETEGEQPTYKAPPDLGPGHNKPSGDTSDPRGDLKQAEDSGAHAGSGRTGALGGNFNSDSKSGGGLFNSEALSAAETAGLAAMAGPATSIRSVTKSAKKFLWSTKRRKQSTVATTLTTATVAGLIVGGTLLSGPFEFVHVAQLLQQFHFGTQQNESNDRVGKLIRYARYAPHGDAYRTNLNYVGNRLADGVEVKLRKQGLRSAYSQLFGLKQGYIIDRNNENFAGLTDLQIEHVLQEEFSNPNLTVTKYTDPRGVEQLLLKQPTSYRESLSFNREVLRKDGLGSTASAIGARIMGTRDNVSWHPLKKLDNKTLGAVENGISKLQQKKQEWQKEKVQNIADGVPDAPGGVADPQDRQGATQAEKNQTNANANSSASEGNAAASEGNAAASQAKSGADPTTTLTDFTSHVGFKITAGAASAAGVLCVARSIAQNADEVKQKQVELPLVRTGVRAISEGNQVMSGQDIDINQLALDSKQLTDSKTHKSWYDAQSIQAEVGKTGQGVPPDDTLTTISNGSPLDFLVSGTSLADALGPVCSSVGQGVQLVVGFFGGPVSALAGLVGGAVLGPPIIDKISHYLAGQAIELNPSGPKFGNYINYGARLAANDQGLSSGGRALSSSEEGQLADIVNADYKKRFDQHNIAYRLFNPNDRLSLVASIMDQQSNSVPANLNNMALATANVGHSMMTTFANIFSGVGHAATPAHYDYGFPEVAFSEREMDNRNVQNPYANGDAVADILDHNGQNGQPDYISMVGKCFGDTLHKISVPGPRGGSNDVWDVQYGTDPVNIYSPDYKSIAASCNSTADTNWLKIRFFIFDTQNIKSLDCYQGDDQSCSDVGFGQPSGNGNTGNATVTANGLTNPFPDGWVPNRLDMGYDGTFKNKIVAPFDGTITYAGDFNGWNGSKGIIIKADKDVGLPTRSLYFTEGVAPIVHSGQHVTAGTPIANTAPSPYGDSYGQGSSGAIEWGVSQDGSVGSQVDTEAIALGTGSSAARQMVLDFAKWAHESLGVAPPSETGNAGSP